jgi:hypothetical protein
MTEYDQTVPSRKLSSAGEFHSHALPEPDVNLSIHPAPIAQPLTSSAPNGRTGWAVGRVSATTIAMLAVCARVVFCTSVAPIAQENHPACAMRRGAPKRESARSSEPSPSESAGSNGRSLPRLVKGKGLTLVYLGQVCGRL